MSSIIIPFTFTPDTEIFSSQVNANYVAITNVVNGGLDNSNIASNAGIVLSKLSLNPGGAAFNRTTTANQTWGSGLTTDSVPRVVMFSDKGLQFGAGAASALDLALQRTAAKTLQLNDTAGGSVTFQFGGTTGILDMAGGSIINVGSIAGGVSLANATLQGLRVGISTTPGIPADGTSTTIALEPYIHGQIGLYNGTGWLLFDLSAGLSIAVPATTATGYDIYVNYNAGTPILSLVAWGGLNTPPTRDLQNGVLVQHLTPGNRLVGCFQTGGTSGQTSDRASERFVWNLNNQLPRPLFAQVPATSWTLAAVTTWRPADNSVVNGAARVAFFIGLANQTVNLAMSQPWDYTTSAAANNRVGLESAIAIDSITTPSSSVAGGQNVFVSSTVNSGGTNAVGYAPSGLTAGNHFATMLEQVTFASGTSLYTIYGNGSPGDSLTGTIVQ